MQEVTKELQPRWNAVIIDVLSAFIRICEAQGLRYFCAGGTAIGAVRHQGMIPWDDDIDVFMPRPDYDRFLRLAAHSMPEGYELLSPYATKDYPMYFAKMCNARTTLLENERIPCVFGLYIDIFPLDGACDDVETCYREKRRFKRLMNKLEAVSTHNSFGEYVGLLAKRREWGRFAVKTVAFCCRSWLRRWLLKQMDSIAYGHDYALSSRVVTYSGAYQRQEIYPKAWLETPQMFAFEGLMVNLPHDYDAYLRHFFGNYMTLPPVEQRASHHQKVFFDLDKRLDLKAIKRILNLKK
ncbi:LicD family protein [Segatella maculosa]|mgnify:FL=1|uniref:LicD family protein n=1 Tax=Segatella maculosa TaxID=439703 RepID=UPI002490AB6E|nr:LicD family protein [Segatella maculosa]